MENDTTKFGFTSITWLLVCSIKESKGICWDFEGDVWEHSDAQREGVGKLKNKSEYESMDNKSEQGWVGKQDKLQTDRGTKPYRVERVSVWLKQVLGLEDLDHTEEDGYVRG